MNISRFTKENKYGGYTWEIKLNEEFIIELNSSDINSFVVNFKEAKWIMYKTIFSIVLNENLGETIKIACVKMLSHMQKLSRYSDMNEFHINRITTDIIQELQNSSDPIEKLYMHLYSENPIIEGIYPIKGFSTIGCDINSDAIEEESDIAPMNGLIIITSTEIRLSENDKEFIFKIVSSPKYTTHTNIYKQNYTQIEFLTEYQGTEFAFRFNYLANKITEKVWVFQTVPIRDDAVITSYILGI